MPPGDADWNMLRVLQKLDQGLKLHDRQNPKEASGSPQGSACNGQGTKMQHLDLQATAGPNDCGGPGHHLCVADSGEVKVWQQWKVNWQLHTGDT